MKTFIKGVEVEGTPQEIAELMKLTGETFTVNQINTTGPIGSESITNTNPCLNCPNYGKGPCLCTIPYQRFSYTYTGSPIKTTFTGTSPGWWTDTTVCSVTSKDCSTTNVEAVS